MRSEKLVFYSSDSPAPKSSLFAPHVPHEPVSNAKSDAVSSTTPADPAPAPLPPPSSSALFEDKMKRDLKRFAETLPIRREIEPSHTQREPNATLGVNDFRRHVGNPS